MKTSGDRRCDEQLPSPKRGMVSLGLRSAGHPIHFSSGKRIPYHSTLSPPQCAALKVEMKAAADRLSPQTSTCTLPGTGAPRKSGIWKCWISRPAMDQPPSQSLGKVRQKGLNAATSSRILLVPNMSVFRDCLCIYLEGSLVCGRVIRYVAG